MIFARDLMSLWIKGNKLSTEQREFIAAIKKDTAHVHWVQGAAGIRANLSY